MILKITSYLLSPLYLSILILGCSQKTETAITHDMDIRYGENKTPIYISCDNCSAGLESDPKFLKLQKNNKYKEIVYEFMESNKDLFKIKKPKSELMVTDVAVDPSGQKHIRLQQVAGGVPIWGKDMRVHLNRDNRVYFYQGRSTPSFKNFSTKPSISKKEAEARVVSFLPDKSGKWRTAENNLCIWMTEAEIPKLAYRITMIKGLRDRDIYFLDAGNGKFLHKIAGNPR